MSEFLVFVNINISIYFCVFGLDLITNIIRLSIVLIFISDQKLGKYVFGYWFRNSFDLRGDSMGMEGYFNKYTANKTKTIRNPKSRLKHIQYNYSFFWKMAEDNIDE